MRMISVLALLGSIAALLNVAVAQDVAGATDHPAIGRFEGAEITMFEQLDDGAQRMITGLDPERYEAFEGTVTRYVYAMPEGAYILQVLRSYEQALSEEGFETRLSCINNECYSADLGRLRETVWRQVLNNAMGLLTVTRETDEGVINAQITIAPEWINVNIVERVNLENRMLDADAMAKRLSETGSVVLDKVYFDLSKATLLAESADALTEIAKLLEENPDINIYIVGHTDNTGGYASNLDLSLRRAQAVADALVSDHGVAANRVVPAGVGPLAPRASNLTEDGQARNRRLELVRR